MVPVAILRTLPMWRTAIATLLGAVFILPARAVQQTEPERAAFGRWHVTQATCPDRCAMTSRQWNAWWGKSAVYTKSTARFGDSACTAPVYNVSRWPASGIYGGARLKDFGIRAASTLVIEIRCPSVPRTSSDPRWQVPGAFLIVKDSSHLLTVWEGVFFELTRDRGAS